MTKREIWNMAGRIPNAQNFISEISSKFPIETIMISDKGDIGIYRKANQPENRSNEKC